MSLNAEIKRLVEAIDTIEAELDERSEWSPLPWFNTAPRNTEQVEPMSIPEFEMYDFDEEAKKAA